MKKLLITIAFVGLALAALYPIRGMFPPFYYISVYPTPIPSPKGAGIKPVRPASRLGPPTGRPTGQAGVCRLGRDVLIFVRNLAILLTYALGNWVSGSFGNFGILEVRKFQTFLLLYEFRNICGIEEFYPGKDILNFNGNGFCPIAYH